MERLEELKRQRRELDMKIKELENGNFIRFENTRYEHRRYSTGKEEFIIAVCRPRELKKAKYSEWWGQMLSEKSREALIDKLEMTISNLTQLLDRMKEEA